MCERKRAFALGSRERLCLFHGTSVSAEQALCLDESEIDLDFLKCSGVTPCNALTAGVGPAKLKQLGMESAAQLRSMGFDALSLADTKFCAEAVAAFGADELVETFLTSASDAVALAGTDTATLLGVPATRLLQECAGASEEARAVLQQLPTASALEGVPASVLLDTGLRKAALLDLGLSLTAVARQTRASGADLAKLGFTV